MKNFLSVLGTLLLAIILYLSIGVESYKSDFENLEYFATFKGKNLYEQFKSEIDSLNDAKSPENKDNLNQDSLETEESADASQNLNLSLVDIFLEQGEEGEKVWEMEAEWANYAEKSGNLFTYKPYITFFDKNKNPKENTFIQGETGKVLENNSLLTLSKDVRIEKNTMNIVGEYLEFEPKNEYATMPLGALLEAEETIGKAKSINWDMLKNDIQARGNVVFILNNDNKTFKLDDARKNPPIIQGE